MSICGDENRNKTGFLLLAVQPSNLCQFWVLNVFIRFHSREWERDEVRRRSKGEIVKVIELISLFSYENVNFSVGLR